MATRTWSAAADSSWSVDASWSGGAKPAAGDTAVFDATSTKKCTIDMNVAITAININAGYSGTITQTGNVAVTNFTQVVGYWVCTDPVTYTFSASTNFNVPAFNATGNFSRFTTDGSSRKEIRDVYDLQACKPLMGSSLIVINDINAAISSGWTHSYGAGYIPIGYDGGGGNFTGTFDGGNYIISNLYSNLSSYGGSNHVGLIASINGGTVKNVKMTNLSMLTGIASNFLGAITGSFGGAGASIHDCYIQGVVTNLSAGTATGGIAAASSGVPIYNCSFVGPVSGGTNLGGITGYINGAGCNVYNCSYTGTITAGTTSTAGGMAGRNLSGSPAIYNCIATLTMSGAFTSKGYMISTAGTTTLNNCIGICSGLTITATGGSVTNCFTDPVGLAVMSPAHAVYNAGGAAPASSWDFGSTWWFYDMLPSLQLTPLSQYAGTSWTGAVNSNWSNAGNWNNGLPSTTNAALFNCISGANDCTIDTDVTPLYTSITGSYSGDITQSANITTMGNFRMAAGTFTDSTPSYTFKSGLDFQIFGGTFNRFGATVGGKYQCRNIYDVSAIRQGLANSYILLNNIDATPTARWSLFIAIGSATTPFTGTLDGDNYYINYLTIPSSTIGGTGLFGAMSSTGTITKLTVYGSVTSTLDNTGGLVGANAGTITYSGFRGIVTSTADNVGGITGANNEGTVRNCAIVANITGRDYVGGVLGYSNSTVATLGNSIDTCSVIGNIVARNYVGGFTGQVATGYDKILKSFYQGVITPSGSYVGGAIGSVAGGGYCEDNYTRAYIINATTYCGGFFGRLVSGGTGNIYINKNYATGTVNTAGRTGGFVGGVGVITGTTTISNCFSTMRVLNPITALSGGFIGDTGGYTIVLTNCGWVDDSNFGENTLAIGSGAQTMTYKQKLNYYMSANSAFYSGWTNWYFTADSDIPLFYDGRIDLLPTFVDNTKNASNYWIGTGNWSNTANWSLGVVPTTTQIATFNNSHNGDCTIDIDVACYKLNIDGYAGEITQASDVGLIYYNQTSGTFTCSTPLTYKFNARYRTVSGGTWNR